MHKFYLGADVSKGYADFVIIDAKKQPVEKNFQLDDTFEGHCLLYNKLYTFCKDHPDSIIYAAVESTGGYEKNWYHSLVKFQSTLSLNTAHLNPFGVSHNRKAGMKRNITDKISAQNIAEYMIAHPEKVSYQPQDYLASLRKQWGFVKMLTKQSTQLLNQLESVVYNANPEALIYCKDGMPDWILKLLKSYPTASRLAKAKIKSVAKIPYISSERARNLVAAAKKSVACTTDKVTEQLVIATVKQIIHLKKVIKRQSEIMANECSIHEVELLKTFKGISDYSAIGLILNMEAVERFASTKKLASYFGIHPVYKKSGDGTWGIHMSKKGRKEPRHILFMVAMSAIKCNPLIRSIYLKHTQKGMKKMAAIGVCMHKILRIVYGMLKHNRAFDPDIDRRNREKIVQCKADVCRDKNRRYQDYDPKAPISRRQKMQRKERELSHSDKHTKSGISAPVPKAA